MRDIYHPINFNIMKIMIKLRKLRTFSQVIFININIKRYNKNKILDVSFVMIHLIVILP